MHDWTKGGVGYRLRYRNRPFFHLFLQINKWDYEGGRMALWDGNGHGGAVCLDDGTIPNLVL